MSALGSHWSERNKIAFMFCSLSESYSTLITSFGAKSIIELTYSLVKNAIFGEYKRRQGQVKANESGNLALRVNRNKN